MKTLLLFSLLTLIYCSEIFCQTKWSKELTKVFQNIPIDSSFEYIVNYAKTNDFTFIDDKSMDSSSIVFVSSKVPNRYIENKASENFIHINYSDSLLFGTNIYTKSFEILLRLIYTSDKSRQAEIDYKKIIKRFSEFGNRISEVPIMSLKGKVGTETLFYLTKDSDIPTFAVSIFYNPIDSHATVGISYLRKNN